MGVLDGKTALVSGGSRGIGRAIVERLCNDGASIVFSFSDNEAAAEEVMTAVRHAGGHAYAVRPGGPRLAVDHRSEPAGHRRPHGLTRVSIRRVSARR
jgi:3-oxoacyl-[acyl-carrier protein] reductase